MPPRSILKISEIFWSFQGEGARSGYPSIFIRLAGCAYACPYCDTKDSWKTGTGISIKEILSRIETFKSHYPVSQVVITGGEPLEQNLTLLVTQLKQRDYFIAIETNGAHFQDIPIDWWTVSPKDVAQYAIHPGLFQRASEIKLVVNSSLTPAIIKEIRGRIPSVPFFLQPEGNDRIDRNDSNTGNTGNDNERYRKTFSLFRQCQEMGIENVRAGIQLHKVYRVS